MENDHDIQRWDGLDLNFPLLYPDWDFINWDSCTFMSKQYLKGDRVEW
jgi:hypothetical protein